MVKQDIESGTCIFVLEFSGVYKSYRNGGHILFCTWFWTQDWKKAGNLTVKTTSIGLIYAFLVDKIINKAKLCSVG